MSSAERTTVQLPSLIVSFLDEEPNTHPLYERVRRESLDWVTTACALDRKTVIKVHKGDLTYFAAVCAPEAEDARYRVFCDWVNWVFPFDDQYDDGELRDDPRRAALELGNLIDNVYGRASPMTKYVKAHEDVWRRFEETATLGNRRRFQQFIADFAGAIGRQVQHSAKSFIPDPDEVLEVRRDSAGARALFVLMEYAEDIQLADQVIEHPMVKRLEDACNDWILIQNDILSYQKEGEEVVHNMVAACRYQGMSAQEAFDHLDSMLHDCYADFEDAASRLPSWGPAVDQEVRRYVEGLKNCVRSNLSFSFRSHRYFGDRRDAVKASGKIDVLERPAYLDGR